MAVSSRISYRRGFNRMILRTPISEMLKFHFGSKILWVDGEEGILTEIVVDPVTRRVTQLWLKQGRFFGKIVQVPFDTVMGASSEAVTLSLKRAEAAATSGDGGAVLDGKTAVERANASARGVLRMVAVHPTSGELAYIVAHNMRPNQSTMLRAEYITEIAKERLVVSIPDEVFNALPPYRSDSELQRDVESILFDITPMHIDLKGISIRVLDGVLYLDGNISSSLRADMAQDQVYGVEGLLEIHNNLVGDDRLAADLAMALGQDARTRDLPLGVYPRLGIVRLSGAVRNNAQKNAAGEIARNFPGVRGVINDLVIDPQEDMLRVMAAPEGGEAEDKVPGKYVRHTQ